MRRIGEHPASEQLHPIRWGQASERRSCGIATRTAFALLLLGAPTQAGDGDHPELTPPADMPVISKPAKPVTSPAPARAPVTAPGGRAVLALPGMAPRAASPTPTSTPSLEPIPGELSLEAPLEMRGAPAPAGPSTSPVPGRSTRPLVLESSPMDEPLPMDGAETRPSTTPKRSNSPRVDSQSAPLTSRRPRLFGLIPGQAPSPSGNSTTARAGLVGRSVVEDAKEDPAVESALKRRIEKQAREAVGDRARAIEVRVVGKNANVQARGVKFFQKRGVRKSLESIPALAGLRSTIEVVD